MENLKGKAGIYKIESNKDKKTYVGSSINLYTRKINHFSKLRNNKHSSKHLQNAYNKYGAENFKFIVLEIVLKDKDKLKTRNKLIEREQYWIDKYQCFKRKFGYNLRKVAESNLGLEVDFFHKKVKNITTGEVFKSIKCASKKLNIERSIISRACSGQYGTAGGFKWAILDNNGGLIIPDFKSMDTRKRIINIETREIFDSIMKASQTYNINRSNINQCCIGTVNMAGGYHWRYVDEHGGIINSKYINKHTRKIINIETKEIFESIVLASKKYNISRDAISNNVSGHSKSSGGYHWQYYEDYLKDKEKEK